MDIDDEQEKDSLSGSWDRIITDTSTKQPNFMKHTIASAKRQSLGNKIKRDRQIVDLRKEFSSISITSGSKQVSKAIQKQQQQQQQPGGTEKLESNKKEKRKRKPLKINTIILESNENQFNLPPFEEKVTIPSRCLPKQSLRRQEFTTKRKSKAKLALQNMNMQIWPENNPLKSPTHTTKETKVVDENKRTKQHDTSKKMHVHKKRVLQKALYMSKLNEIIKEFRQEHKGSLIRAHLAYKANCPDKIFILAYVHCPIKTKMWRLYKGLKVLFMDYLYVDSEAIRVAADKKSSTMKLSETVENELRKSITKHAHDLMSSHSNLQILSGSPVRSKQKGQVIKEEQCIVLFCRNKGYIPLGEKRFPNKIDRFSVDVREGFFQWSPSENQLASEYQSHLRMGCSIGTKGNLHKGSLGGFVDTESGMGFLTCAHVVYNTHELFNQSTISPNATIVVQPADGELMPNDIRDRECGTVLRHAFDPNSNVGVDCAVVNITKRKPDFAESCNLNEDSLRKTGFRPNEILRYTNGKIVNNPHHRHYRDRRLIKCGKTTGLRRGVFKFNGAAVRVDEVPLGLDRSDTAFICLKGQYVVQPVGRAFVDEGDSGALVFLLEDDNSLSCVGMVEGVASNFLAVITPITEILKKLRLDPTKLCVFPEGVMETD